LSAGAIEMLPATIARGLRKLNALRSSSPKRSRESAYAGGLVTGA
jgi:hypothetical protein